MQMRKPKRSLAALFSAIDAAVQTPEADSDVQASVRDRLLARVAQDAARDKPYTVAPQDGEWRSSGAGIEIKVLHRAEAVQSYLLRMAPGAVLPAHIHPVDEECVVLEGEVVLEDVQAGPGTYHLAPQGATHRPIRSDTGCLLFLRGAIPTAEHFRL